MKRKGLIWAAGIAAAVALVFLSPCMPYNNSAARPVIVPTSSPTPVDPVASYHFNTDTEGWSPYNPQAGCSISSAVYSNDPLYDLIGPGGSVKCTATFVGGCIVELKKDLSPKIDFYNRKATAYVYAPYWLSGTGISSWCYFLVSDGTNTYYAYPVSQRITVAGWSKVEFQFALEHVSASSVALQIYDSTSGFGDFYIDEISF